MRVADYDTAIDERHQSFRDFCNRTLHLWNEKTRLASGRTGVTTKASGFGAFDQSILKQIEGILADKQRLVNRTRIKRSAYRILGTLNQPVTKSLSPTKPPPDNTNIVSYKQINRRSPSQFIILTLLNIKENNQVQEAKVIEEEEEFDPEIYDDDDFYHQLLRELIEKRTGEGGSNQVALGRYCNDGNYLLFKYFNYNLHISNLRQWLEIQKLRSKAKRKVDAKASKGRRLRYQIHPKLVSFMAPHPETSWNDTAKNELFASLFGSVSTVH
jgi:protein AATF/BFR2